MKWRLPPWYLFIPFCLLLIELVWSRLYPFSSPYFSVLILKQPFRLCLTSALTLLRVFAAYCVFACVVELGTSWIKERALRVLVFISAFFFSVFFAFQTFPGLSELFLKVSKREWGLSVLALLFLAFLYKKKEPAYAPTPVRVLALSVILLAVTRITPWETFNKPPVSGDSGRPSFVILSFDALPGDIFALEDQGRFSMPLWNRYWKSKGTYFSNAYSVSNSTYTSWTSLLTGVPPLESGVLSLYPAHRKGTLRSEDFLPQKLDGLGYQSSFLTDCANTSFFERDSGFDRLYQPDKGAFGSTRGLVASVHPGLFWLSQLSSTNFLFPELNTFSSHQYSPENFFSEVKNEWKRLDSQDTPFLLVVHSCLTHRDLAHHLPEQGTVATETLPTFHGYRSKGILDLLTSLRSADTLSHEFLTLMEKSNKPTWKFLISDHGVRMDPKDGELTLFSHAIGDAVGRSQYNVPLFAMPPKRETLTNSGKSLVSVQDLGAFVLESALMSKSVHLFPERKSLVLTSTVSSDDPTKWGETLLPLIKSGNLSKEGVFAFSAQDEERLMETRSVAVLKLPYRAVVDSKERWRIFNELNDPFHQTPLKLTGAETLQWLEELRDTPVSVLMAN